MNKNLVVISFVGISIFIVLVLAKIYNQYYISYEGFEDKKDAKNALIITDIVNKIKFNCKIKISFKLHGTPKVFAVKLVHTLYWLK